MTGRGGGAAEIGHATMPTPQRILQIAGAGIGPKCFIAGVLERGSAATAFLLDVVGE